MTRTRKPKVQEKGEPRRRAPVPGSRCDRTTWTPELRAEVEAAEKRMDDAVRQARTDVLEKMWAPDQRSKGRR